MNTGGEKKVKRLRYYIIYKDRREVKDEKRGLRSFFAPCSKYYF